MYYTGIGSREITKEVRDEIYRIAQVFAKLGFTLRSGGADGSDMAFERGCASVNGKKEIYLPWPDFNGNPSHLHSVSRFAMDMAASYCLERGTFGYFKRGTKLLLGRDMYQVLGEDLQTPSKIVVCYTKDGCESHKDRTRQTGGTGYAISCADNNGIKVYNLANYIGTTYNVEDWIK